MQVVCGAPNARAGMVGVLGLPGAQVPVNGMELRVSAIRAYRGFRPFCPDHLPVIGLDPRAPGLWHACGHEGAGIGLSAVTGALIAESITGHTSTVDPHPFRPERFEDAA